MPQAPRPPDAARWLWRALRLTLLVCAAAAAQARTAAPVPLAAAAASAASAESAESAAASAPAGAAAPAAAPSAPPAQVFTVLSAVATAQGREALLDPARSRIVALPDEWNESWPGHEGSVWYRVVLPGLVLQPDAERRNELLALYVEKACSNLAVWLNGRLVSSGGSMREPYSQRCYEPQLVALPTALLVPGANVLDIELVGHALPAVASRQRAGWLSRLVIGPQAELATLQARRAALQVQAPQAVSATLALMGGFMFVLGFVNRRESHLAYFGAMCFGWAVLHGRLWLHEQPFGSAVSEFLVVVFAALVAWAAVQFLLRYAQTRHRLVDRLLPLQAALVVGSLLLAGPERLNAVARFWFVLLAAEVLVASIWHLRHQRHTRTVWGMAALLALAMLAGMIEFIAQWADSAARVFERAAAVAQLVMPVVLVIVGLRLVQQQGRALKSAEADKAQLEARVREATAEVERNLKKLAELRVEQVTERERKRIAADLHDDLGAKLLTIVHTSESERISTLAREALEEMRLSVRGLTGKPVRLADALGDWRAETVSRLAQAGIHGDWDAPEDLPHTLSARAYVQTTRILREATSNIIKHSRATNCSVTAGIADGDFQLVVQDNGDGIGGEIDGRLDRGHGLASMKNRAKQLQGQCLVESGPGWGTVIRLTVPLEGAVEAS